MSLGPGPDDWVSQAAGKAEFKRRMARVNADRAARETGYKSPLRRLRPHRQAPGGDPQSNYGTSDDPGH